MNIKKRTRIRMKTCRALLICIAIAATNVALPVSSICEEKPPKNIIIFIGDGMGIGQVSALTIVKKDSNMRRFKITGLLGSHPVDAFLPDTESGTTSLATGSVSNCTFISLSPEGNPLKTVLEYAKENGESAGLVVTTEVTDTTPACFAAHVYRRGLHRKIAEQEVANGVDLLFGGGLAYFTSKDATGMPGGKDLISQLSSRYPVATTMDEFRKLGNTRGAYAFLALKSLPPAPMREISLAEMTGKAIEILSKNEKGFFLMVEGSQIDWATHRGDTEQLISEMIDFDDAIGAGMDFAQKNQETLVIVTADHETGGYCVVDGSFSKGVVKTATFLQDGHSQNLVPLFAYGPGSSVLGGLHSQEFVGETMINYIKAKDISK